MNHLRKRITTLLLCLCFLLELGPVSAFAAEEETAPAAETVRVLDCAFTPEEGEGCADYYIHVHTADCYDADGVLVCPLEERKLHKHDEACYQEEKTLVCGIAEESDAHHHTDACYETEKILVCEEQTELHTHSEDCYARDEVGSLTDKLICGLLQLEEHVHDDSCFRMELKEPEEEDMQILSEEEGETGDALTGEESGEAGDDDSALSGNDGQTPPANPDKSDETLPAESGNSGASDEGKEPSSEDAGVTGEEDDKQDTRNQNPEQEENKEDDAVSETGENQDGEEKQEPETEKPAADAGAADAAAAASDENEKKENADDSSAGSENDKQDSDSVSGEEEKKPEAEKEPSEGDKQNDAPKPAEASGGTEAKDEGKTETTGEAGKEEEKKETAEDEAGKEEKDDAEEKEPAVDPSQHPLVEIEASDDEPLLAEENLPAAMRTLLGLSAPQPKLRGAKKAPMLKAAPAANLGPVESDDGTVIEKIYVKWLTHSTGSEEPAGEGTLALVTSSDEVASQQFQIDFALSGKDDYEPGTLMLTFPAWIWLDRNGNEPGRLTLSVPEDPENGADFAWKRVGDNIVITNMHRLSAASKVMIQGSFRNLTPHEMVDLDVSPDSAYAGTAYPGQSKEFSATIGVVTAGGSYIELTSNSIDATINTNVEAASATKSAYNTSKREYYVYHTLQQAKDAGIPQEFLDTLGNETAQSGYSFVRWYVSGSATGSQPFKMTVNETFNGNLIHYTNPLDHSQTETVSVEGKMLGVQGALNGNVVSEDGVNVSAVLYDGYNTLPKSAYVWTAYKQSSFPEAGSGDEYSVSNSQTIRVTGWDDRITTTKEATDTIPFRLPIIYTIQKQWLDNNDEAGHRPDAQDFTVRYYNGQGYNYSYPSTSDASGWQTSWSDEGQDREYSTWESGSRYNSDFLCGYPENVDPETHVHTDDCYLSKHKHVYGYPNRYVIPSSVKDILDDDGNVIGVEFDWWWYSQKSSVYEKNTHTWTYVNEYHKEHRREYKIPFTAPVRSDSMSKSTASHYYPSRTDRHDRDLNVLRTGHDAIVSYNVSGSSRIMYYTLGSGLDRNVITSYGRNSITLELEDNYGTDILSDVAVNNTLYFDNVLTLEPVIDAEIDSVTLNAPSFAQYKQVGLGSFWSVEYEQWSYQGFQNLTAPVEELWGCDKDGNWTRYAVMTASVSDSRMSTQITAENGARASGSTVTLPAGVWKVKTVMTVPGIDPNDPDYDTKWASRIDSAGMSYRVAIRLKGTSENLLNRLEAIFAANDYGMASLQNFAALNISVGDTRTRSLSDSATAWLHGRNHRVAVRAEKSFELVDNDVLHRQLTLHSKVTMTQQSNVLDQSEYNEARREGLIPWTDSGTWYDLLPIGVLPDLDTITLSSGDTITDRYTVPNYKESGRTLLVVKADVQPHVSFTNTWDPNPYANDDTYPKEGYKDVHTLEFDAYYSWDESRLYGLEKVRNVAAYEADEEALGNINGWRGEPDNPQANQNQRAMDAVGTDNLDLMTGLDTGRNPSTHTAFVYAGEDLKYERPDFMADTQLRKYVTREGLGVWSSGRDGSTQVSVYEGGYYSYMLYVVSDSETHTKNMILVDSLENYAPIPSDKEPKRNRWKGDFVSVDTAGLEELGIAPVVYYHTGTPDLSFLQEQPGVGNTTTNVNEANIIINALTAQGSGWTTTLPADPSTVTAIAVDIRYMQDGSEFVLKEDESLNFTVTMKAKVYETVGEDSDPFNANETLRKAAENNDYAYNNINIGCTQVDQGGLATHAIIHYNYVRVGIVPFELEVSKVWDDQNNNDGKRPTAVEVTLVGNGTPTSQSVILSDANNWTGRFSHVLRYDENGEWINYTFQESVPAGWSGTLEGYTQNVARNDDKVTLTNRYTPEKTTVNFEKKWGDPDHPEEAPSEEAIAARPSSITVRLMADDVYTGKSVTVTPDRYGDWKGSFANLPVYSNPTALTDAQHRIVYSVKEQEVYLFEDSYKTDADTGLLTIWNNYWPYGLLEVTKAITDETDISKDREFTFTLLLKDKDGNDLTEKYPYFKYDANGDLAEYEYTLGNADEFTLRGGERIILNGIPAGSTYEVVESPADGFTLVSSSGSSGTIFASARKASEVSFTNRYAAEGSQILSLRKTLTGRNMTYAQFAFELVDSTEGSETEGQVIRTTSNNRPAQDSPREADAVFGSLKYTEKDHGKTFVYEIREIDRGRPGYLYDMKTTYTAEVTVTDNGNGSMTCTPKYYRQVTTTDGDSTVTSDPVEVPAAEVLFNNEYHADGEITLRAWKQLPGGSLKDYGPFTFELVNAAGDVLQEKACDDKGTVAFEAIRFTEEDVGKSFFYVIREKAGVDTRVNYDNTLRGIALTVADNGNGTLAVTQTNVTVIPEHDGNGNPVPPYTQGEGTSELPVFTNTLEPGSISVTKLTKWDETEPDGNVAFPFTLTLSGDELPETITVSLSEVENAKAYSAGNAPTPLTDAEKAWKEVSLEITSPADTTPVTGVYSFSLKAGQKLNVKDLPAGISYQFQEAIPSGWTLTFENVAGTVRAQETLDAVYTNKHEPGTAVATMLATKRLDGRTPAEKTFLFELVEDTEGAGNRGDVLETLWNHASGYVLFDRTYTQAGTYHYLIRELQELPDLSPEGEIQYDSEGKIKTIKEGDALRTIEFDENVYGVTVVVTETDNGGSKTLNATVTYDQNENTPPRFENKTRPGSLQITKVGNGLTEANKDAVFTFKVALSNDAGMPLTESGNMFWYAEAVNAAEQTPVEEDPETPEQPENAEPEPETAPAPAEPAQASSLPTLKSTRLALKGAPVLRAPLAAGSRSLVAPYTIPDGEFAYTGAEQIYRVAVSGWYRLETWGAQGGDYYMISFPGIRQDTVTSRGGYGGYSTGEIYLEAGTTLYVFVGGAGQPVKYNQTSISSSNPLRGGYNGGGWMIRGTPGTGTNNTNPSTSHAGWSNSGGGMTHISTTNNPVVHGSSWSSAGTLLVAGGGGGADNASTTAPANTRGNGTGDDGGGGDGGGQYGGNALVDGVARANTGGGYTNSSLYNYTSNNGNGTSYTDRSNTYHTQGLGQDNTYSTDTGAGGGGWYGGRVTGNNNGGAGGGSGYVSSSLRNAETKSGSGNIPAPEGGTERGHFGNGYARITALDYTIIFDKNNEDATGEPVTVTEKAGTGYTLRTADAYGLQCELGFAGWSTDPDATLPEYAAGETYASAPGESVTLYAVWVPENAFMLHYDALNGSVTPQWQLVNGPDATVTMPTAVSGLGHTFLGWTFDAEGETDPMAGTVSGSFFNAAPGTTVTLYAQYIDPSQKIRLTTEHYWEKPDGSGTFMATPTNVDITTYDVTETEATPPTRTYTGFVSPETQTITLDQNGENKVVYEYLRTRYAIAFDANGGEGSMNSVNMLGGVSAKLPVNRFTKENALFVGWNTEPDGSGTNYGDGQTVNSIGGQGDTVTLYAQWYKLDEAQSATPTNGEYTVTCKANETIVFPQLPAGTHYTVTEVQLPDGWSLDGIDPDAGTVLSAERINVTATNTYSASGYADLLAHKSLPGENISAGQFRFELVDDNEGDARGTVLQTVTNGAVDAAEQIAGSGEDAEPVANPYYGTAPVRFDSLSFTAQGVYHYLIREAAGSDSAIRYDGHVEKVTVLVKDRGDGRLTTQVFYDESGPNFRNTMSNGSLKVSKTLHNATEEAAKSSFSFTLYFFDRNGVAVYTDFPVTLPDGSETTVHYGGSISIKGGESFTVSELPHQSSYIVTESPADGFELVNSVHPEGSIEAGKTTEASFENAYSSRTPEANGGAIIDARKVFEGGEIQENQFQFRLLDGDRNVLETVFAGTDGTVEFSPLHYTLADNGQHYLYYVEEVPGVIVPPETPAEPVTDPDGSDTGDGAEPADGTGDNTEPADGTGDDAEPAEPAENIVADPDVIYDTHQERIAVTVSDNGDGTMTAAVEYNNRENTPPVFTNVVNHGDLIFGKTVTDLVEENKDTAFSFTLSLKDAEDKALEKEYSYYIYTEGSEPTKETEPSGTVLDGGTVSLKNGEFCLVKGLPTDTKYTVTEAETENFRLAAVYDAEGTVLEAATGSIGANQTSFLSLENEDISPVKLTVKKIVEGEETDQKFQFTLTLKDKDGNAYTEELPVPAGIAWTSNGGGQYTFLLGHGEELSFRLPKGTQYTLREKRASGYLAGIVLTDKDGKELKNGSKAPSASGTLSHETGPVTVTYTNVPGGLIPGVGGTGTTLFYVLGLILLLGGGSALVLTGRRRRRAGRSV